MPKRYSITHSIVIPVKDEEESLGQLYNEIISSTKFLKNRREIIFIDDGSVDNSYQKLLQIQKKDSNVRVIRFRANFGKSAALSKGFEIAKGSIFITLDADLQDDPAEIPKLLSYLARGFDLVVGRRKKRNDTTSKKISSLAFNLVTRIITGINLHDVNCGIKVLKRDVAKDIRLHGELHRFIPVLAAKKKYRVTEVSIHHRPRKFGKSKFGFERAWRGMIDLITTEFLTDYIGKPAHLFGTMGAVLSFIGLLLTGYVTVIRIITGGVSHHVPLLLGGILLLVLGVQLISTGLIAEMITYYNKETPKYE